jgi:hypothetical protein
VVVQKRELAIRTRLTAGSSYMPLWDHFGTAGRLGIIETLTRANHYSAGRAFHDREDDLYYFTTIIHLHQRSNNKILSSGPPPKSSPLRLFETRTFSIMADDPYDTV